MGVAVTDAKHYLIPDGFTVFGLLWVLATSLVGAYRGDLSLFASPYDALIGACVGAGALSIAAWLGEVALKKEAMGFGDITLMAVVGGALGPNRVLLVIFLTVLLRHQNIAAKAIPITVPTVVCPAQTKREVWTARP